MAATGGCVVQCKLNKIRPRPQHDVTSYRLGMRQLAALLLVGASLTACSAVEDFLKDKEEREDTRHFWNSPTASNSEKFGAANVGIQRAQRADPTTRRIEEMISSQMFSWANKREGAPIQVPYVGGGTQAMQTPPQPWQQAQPIIKPSFQETTQPPPNMGFPPMAQNPFQQGFSGGGEGPVSMLTGRRIRLSDDYKGLIADSENARYDRMFAPNPQATWGMAQQNAMPAFPNFQGSWPKSTTQQGQWPSQMPQFQQGTQGMMQPPLPMPLQPQALQQQQAPAMAWGQMQQGGPLMGMPSPMPMAANPYQQQQPQQQAYMPQQWQQPPTPTANPYQQQPVMPQMQQAQGFGQGQGWPPMQAPPQIQQQAQQQMLDMGMDPNFPPWQQPQRQVQQPQQPMQMANPYQQQAQPQSQGQFQGQFQGMGLPSQQAQGYGMPPQRPQAMPQPEWRTGAPPVSVMDEQFNSVWPQQMDVAQRQQQRQQEPVMPSNRLYTEYANERTDVAQSAQALAAQRALQRQSLTFEDLRSNSIVQSPLYADAIAPADGRRAPSTPPAPASTVNPTQMVGSFALGEFFGSNLAYMPDVQGTTTFSVVPDPNNTPPDHPFKGLENVVASQQDPLDRFFATDEFVNAMRDVDPLYFEENPPESKSESATESAPQASALTYQPPAPVVTSRVAPLPPPLFPKLDVPYFVAPKPVAVAPIEEPLIDTKQTAAIMDEQRQIAKRAVQREPDEVVAVATIYFHRNDARLSEDDWHIINQVARLHGKYKGVVHVHGYASTMAADGLPRSYEDSMTVSLRQANVVAKALIEQGMDPRKISIKGFADMSARVVGPTSVNAMSTSRVEISFAY